MTGGKRPYLKGARAEYIVRDRLRAEGWLVMRSYGSKGPFDLLALRRSRVALLEVKSHQGYMPPADRRRLAALAAEYDAEPVLAHYQDGDVAWSSIGLDGSLEASWTP